MRACEESAYGDGDLARPARWPARVRSARSRSSAGRFLAAVEDGDELWSTSTSLPVLDEPERAAFVEAVAAEAGRLPALLAGDLPHLLVEHAEEAGVELLPYGGELAASCTCAAWVDPCAHALAVAYQVAWLADADPFVLLALRGLPREDLLARLHEREERPLRAARRRRGGGSTPPLVPAGSCSCSSRATTSSTCCDRPGHLTGSRDASLVPRRLGPSRRSSTWRLIAVLAGSDRAALRSRNRGNRGR